MRWYEKKRLTEQLKFFNYKPKRFISVYAKKPRILVKEKTYRIDLRSQTMIASMQSQIYTGMQNTHNAYLQREAMLANQQAAIGSQGQGLSSGLGGAGIATVFGLRGIF